MALSSKKASDAIWGRYMRAVGLDDEGDLRYEDGEWVGVDLDGFQEDWAEGYDEYAKDGVVLGADNVGGDVSILVSALNSVKGQYPSYGNSIDILANGLAQYWATVAVENGTPAHGGTEVLSVVNNAATLAPAFKAAITSSVTQSRSEPFFKVFVDNVESVVSTIVYTVTELMPTTPPSPSVFVETIK